MPDKKKDNRSVFQKLKDEGKQIVAGLKNLDPNEFRPSYNIGDFKEGYSSEERKQAAERAKKSMAYGGTMDMKKVKGMGGKHSAKKMADKRYEHGGIIKHD